MNYYVVSPNIYNDGNNYAQKMFTKGIAAVGWDTDSQKGQQFDSITQGDCIIVAQRINWQWTYYYMGIVLGNEDKPSYGTLSKRLSPIISLEGIDLNFEYWTANGSNQVPSPQRIDINSNINIIENINKIFNMQKYTDLLKSNHNLILTGAPGTGKTYLAKQIAKQMIFGEIKEKMSPDEERQFNEQCGFVQFHPSYDYTDFVEGLRPVQDDNGNVGFELRYGVFKVFCSKAVRNFVDSKKSLKQLNDEKSFRERYYNLIDMIENGIITKFDLKSGKQMDIVEISDRENIIIRTHNSERTYTVSLDRLAKLAKVFENINALNGISNIDKTIRGVIKGCHSSSYWAALKAVYEQDQSVSTEEIQNKIEKKPFVFIIDEINRGEISKIFGELFFSIDPSYRGFDGKVRTQYANMQTDDSNEFDDALGITDPDNYGYFFVPENVYIIGTMNDIDRSVESMDFAFRRRFAFKEITAEYSKQMLEPDDAWGKDENGNSRKPNQADIDTIKNKMDAINNVIWHKVKEEEKDEDKSIEGFSSAYHIGASYFLKLANYRNDNGEYDKKSFTDLWDNHLEGLLREYMRGMQNIDEIIEKLKTAYNNESDNNNGQQQQEN